MAASKPNLDLILAIINEVLDESGREAVVVAHPATLLVGDLGLDSLDLAVLMVKVESKTGIDVFADGMVTTIGEILEKIDV